MKAMELPISTLIVVIIAVLLFLALLALFNGVWNPNKGSMDRETAKNNACQMLVSMRCITMPENIAVHDFDANKNGNLNDPGIAPGINGPEPWNPLFAGNPNCGTGATSGDNLATLCLCYYNIPDNATCRQTLCGCKG
jgi:hypothetical protein